MKFLLMFCLTLGLALSPSAFASAKKNPKPAKIAVNSKEKKAPKKLSAKNSKKSSRTPASVSQKDKKKPKGSRVHSIGKKSAPKTAMLEMKNKKNSKVFAQKSVAKNTQVKSKNAAVDVGATTQKPTGRARAAQYLGYQQAKASAPAKIHSPAPTREPASQETFADWEETTEQDLSLD